MTIKEAIDKFCEWRSFKRKKRTINGEMRHLYHFCMYLQSSEIEVENIALQQCMDWLKIQQALGYDENTLQKKALAIKMMFEYLDRTGLKVLNYHLIPLPQKTFKFPRVATEEEYNKLLSAIGHSGYAHIRNRALIMMLWDSGARNGEIVSLDMDDIDIEKMSARVKTEKSRGNIPFREIFWSTKTNVALKKWLKERNELIELIFERYGETLQNNALWIGIRGGHINCKGRGRRIPINYVSEILRIYSNKAGLPIILNPHSMRHHLGRELAIKGLNNSGISSILGHSNLQSSYIYTMLFGSDRERLYRQSVKRDEE